MKFLCGEKKTKKTSTKTTIWIENGKKKINKNFFYRKRT